MVGSLIANTIIVVLALASSALAWLIIAKGTSSAYRGMQARGLSSTESGILACGAAIVLLLGGWMILGLYWLAAWARRCLDSNAGPALLP